MTLFGDAHVDRLSGGPTARRVYVWQEVADSSS